VRGGEEKEGTEKVLEEEKERISTHTQSFLKRIP